MLHTLCLVKYVLALELKEASDELASLKKLVIMKSAGKEFTFNEEDNLISFVLTKHPQSIRAMLSVFAVARILFSSGLEDIIEVLSMLTDMSPGSLLEVVKNEWLSRTAINNMVSAMLTDGRVLGPVNVAIERQMLRWLQEYCDAALLGYPRSYEEDSALLLLRNSEDFPRYSNQRNALVLVRGEKEVLRFYRDFAILALGLLEIDDPEVFQAIVNARGPMVASLLKVTVAPLIRRIY